MTNVMVSRFARAAMHDSRANEFAGEGIRFVQGLRIRRDERCVRCCGLCGPGPSNWMRRDAPAALPGDQRAERALSMA